MALTRLYKLGWNRRLNTGTQDLIPPDARDICTMLKPGELLGNCFIWTPDQFGMSKPRHVWFARMIK